MTSNSKNLTRFIYGFFFLSGMTGLVYQVLWSKYLSNIFGSSAYAHTIVLAVFMGGLAFGNYFLGRFADRSKVHLLYVYGLIEIAIGVYCMVYPNIASGIERLYQSIGQSLHLESTHATLFLIQFLLNAVSILIPTTLMGGTLPVMTKFITKSKSEILNKVSILYFINSGGAVLGSLFCGFFFIRLWGLDMSITVAALMNIIIGLLSLRLSQSYTIEENPPQQSSLQESESSSQENTQSTLILWAIGASGFVSMLYEIMWIRTLIQFFGSSVYSFAIVVAAFIAGITLGSAWLAGRRSKMKDLYLFFGIVEGTIAVTMYFCVLSLGFFTEWIWFLHQLFSPIPAAYPVYLSAKFLIAFTILFIPSFFIGMTLPLASAICSKNFKILGQEVGGVFSVNTIGAVLGTSIAGLIFLPVFGIAKSFLIGISINMAIAILLLFVFRKQTGYSKIAVIFTLFLTIFWLQPLNIEQANMISSMFRYRSSSVSFKDYMYKVMAGRDIVFFKSGIDSNVAVVKNADDTLLYINGKPDASGKGDMPTQLLSGHIPALLHKNPKKALVIGFGSGATVGALTRYPSIERIDCLEISKAVIEAGVYFKEFNNDAVNHKKVRIIIDDAKNFLSFNNEKYDLVISEPTNPWTAGTGSLLTQEAFERIRRTLNDDGLFLQWYHGYEMSNELFQNFGHTLTHVFPYVSVWQPMENDYFFISQFHPFEIDEKSIQERIKSTPDVDNNLKQISADSVYTLLTTQIMSEENTKRYFRKGALNRDRFPLIEFNAPLAFFLHKDVTLVDHDERLHPGKTILSAVLDRMPIQPPDMKTLFLFLQKTGQPVYDNFTRVYALQLRDLFPDGTKERIYFEGVILRGEADVAVINRLKQMSDENPNSAAVFQEYLRKRINIYMGRYSVFFVNPGEYSEIEQLALTAGERFPDQKSDFAFLLAIFYSFHLETEKALAQYFALIQNLDHDQTVKSKNNAKRALLLATELSLKETDEEGLRAIAALVKKYFPENQELLLEIKRKKEQL